MQTSDRLPLISVHSYRGGVGKTTITSLLGAALSINGHNVCLVDLDLTAPGLASVFLERPEKGILDYLLIDPDTGRRKADVRAIIHQLNPAVEFARGELWGILGKPEFDNARAIQAYLLAEVRTGMLSACLEHLLREVQKQASPRFHVFLLDTPPSLFGLSAGARQLVREHAGVEVFVAGPTVQDLAWVPEMILQLIDPKHRADAADTDGCAEGARTRPAFVLNAYPGRIEGGEGADFIADQILRARGKQDRSRSRMWAGTLGAVRTRVIPQSDDIRALTLDPHQAGEDVWKRALCPDVRSLAAELARDVIAEARR